MPNLGDRNPTGEHSEVHTCILADLSHEPEQRAREYWSHRAVSSLERSLQRAGARTRLVNRSDIDLDGISNFLRDMLQNGVNSVVMLGDSPGTATRWNGHLYQLRDQKGPDLSVTQIRFGNPDSLPFDTVSFNGSHGTFLAASHLLSQGHRNIGMLMSTLDNQWVRNRVAGFLRAMEMANLVGPVDFANGGHLDDERLVKAPEPPVSDEWYDTWHWSGLELGRRYVREHEFSDRFSAFLAINDQMAIGFMEGLREAGQTVPAAVSLIGFDDQHSSKSAGLTTVHPPIEEMGEAAAALVLQRRSESSLNGNVEIMLHPTLVVRSTIAACQEC